MGCAPREDLELGHETWRDAVADEARQALLDIQGLAHAPHVPRPVLHANDERAAGGVRKGDDCLGHTMGRGEVPLELEGLPLGTLEQLDDVHGFGTPLRGLRRMQPTSARHATRRRPQDALGAVVSVSPRT